MCGTADAEPRALEALERFVVDNDDLLELEERIGRFNIFDALGVARAEIRHSNFLAWLLDPAESHGQSALFLKAVLMDLLRQAPAEKRPLSPVELDGVELRGVEIRREWRHIDILITCESPSFVIAIENKVDSGEHGGQLQRYEDAVAQHLPDRRAMFVFLTPDGQEASDEDWVPCSYREIHCVLARCRRMNQGAIGDDVLAFLDHYLRLIGSRFMDDPKIDELCKRIYRNHRQAIDLIVERALGPSELVSDLQDLLDQDGDRWHIFNTTSRRVDFVPAEWLSWLPPLSAKPKADPRSWFFWQLDFQVDKRRLHLFSLIGPCKDSARRRRIIDRLLRDPREFGFRSNKKQVTERWTRMYSEKVVVWPEEEGPDRDAVCAAVKKTLDAVHTRVEGVGRALQPLLDG